FTHDKRSLGRDTHPLLPADPRHAQPCSGEVDGNVAACFLALFIGHRHWSGYEGAESRHETVAIGIIEHELDLARAPLPGLAEGFPKIQFRRHAIEFGSARKLSALPVEHHP